MGLGSIRYSGDTPTFSLLNQIRGLFWIRCQLVARRKREAVKGSLNTYLENITALGLFAKYFYIFRIKRSKCSEDIKSFAKRSIKLLSDQLVTSARICYSCYLGIVHESLSLVSFCFRRKHQRGG
jgi:hypothetical protein